MADCGGALRALCDPEREVSAHYLVGRDGTVHQLVDEDQRAWHAGVGAWGGQGDVNSRSIGIELDNCGFSPFSARLMDSLEALLSGILTRHAIPPQGVIGHSDMAPGRKIDPGRRFDWQRLARAGLSVWPEVTAVADASEATFRADLHRFGYPGAATLDTFRMRFRPWGTGPLAPEDCAAAAALARRFPVDQRHTAS